MPYVVASDAEPFLRSLPDRSVDLFLIDPPYCNTARPLWEKQWDDPAAYTSWLVGLGSIARDKVRRTGSLIVFQPLGKHGHHPIFDVIRGLEESWHFRNWITWKRNRAPAKNKTYPNCRDEILWFSASADDSLVTFNVPFLDQAPKRPGKTPLKKVTNVWDDVPQVFRPTRVCERPLPLIARLIKTHSDPGELIVDFFSGSGTTGIVAHNLGRRFLGCEAIAEDAEAADGRVTAAKRVAGADSVTPQRRK